MSASLVGSEMCIRDRAQTEERANPRAPGRAVAGQGCRARVRGASARKSACLLYTSDAADDM
eukprot:10228979-Alexandrium_andersonii.AAC.1